MASRQLVDAAALVFPPALDLADADDAALARALQEHEEHAPRVAWDRFSPIVRRVLRRSFGPEHDVEDLVQDVFLGLFDRISQLREPSALRAFVISIAVHTVRYEIRRRKVRRWVGLAPNAEVTDLRVVHPNVHARAALVRFYRILDTLRTRHRTAFVLHYIEGIDVFSVASALGISVPTARRSLSHAWQRVLLLAERDPVLAEFVGDLIGAAKTGEKTR